MREKKKRGKVAERECERSRESESESEEARASVRDASEKRSYANGFIFIKCCIFNKNERHHAD